MAAAAIPAFVRKVVFHPFGSWHCNTQVLPTQVPIDPTESWQKIMAKLYKDSPENSKTMLLSGMTGVNDTIYIPGQCTAASPKLFSFNLQDSVDVKTLAQMLMKYVSTNFAGKIKIYACHSGSDGPQGKHSFGKSFANYMRMFGYTNCLYFGYTAQVSAYATQVYQGSANLSVRTNQHRFAMSGNNAGQRASTVRVAL